MQNIFKDDNETSSSNGRFFQTYVNGATTHRPTHAEACVRALMDVMHFLPNLSC